MVSIIVPVYNVENYLDECIQSLINQTYKDIEIILVNDGSTDRSKEICEKYVASDARVRLINQKNGGLSKARNTGLDNFTGEYIIFVDSDDCLKKDCIEIMYSIINSRSVDCVAARITQDKNKWLKAILGDTMIINPEQALKSIFTESKINTSASSKIYKKMLWNGIRFPEGKIFEDYATIYKVIDKAQEIAVVDYYAYYYRVNNDGIMHAVFNKDKMNFFEATEQIISFMNDKYPRMLKYVQNHATRYAISFYKSYSSNDYVDDEIEKQLISITRKNILKYLFSGFSIFSKAYGVLMALSPSLAHSVFKSRK